MLTIYRRHSPNCPHRNQGRKYRRCKCPIWVDGFVGSVEVRRSAHTRDWNKALELSRQLELEGEAPPDTGPVSIEQAHRHFVRDLEARKLQESTVRKYRLLFRQLDTFAAEQGIRFVRQLDTPACRKFRSTWELGSLAALKALERLRTFFEFCRDNGWLTENPAKKVANPKTSPTPTMPFTDEEIDSILAACDDYAKAHPGAAAIKLRALVVLLRSTGLRISDAVSLRRDRIVDGKLLLYTVKTGTAVYLPLPSDVLALLDAVPGRYYFWSGRSKVSTATAKWRSKLAELFRLAGIQGGHTHRFRDTFAVSLLLAGVPIERVSILLGHQSTRITEKHYAPWVRSRQEQLEEDVRRVWEVQTKGTKRVQQTKPTVN